MHMMSILCSIADVVILDYWFTLIKVVILNVAKLTLCLHLSNFGLGLCLITVIDVFENWEQKSNHSRRRPLLTSARGQCGLDIWFGLESLQFFVGCFFHVNRCHSYRGVAVISCLKYLILTFDLCSSTKHLVKLAVDPTLDSSAELHIQSAHSLDFQ